MVGSIAWVAGRVALSTPGVLKTFLSHRLPFLPVSQALDILTGVFLALGAIAAVAALHALQRRHYGWQGALSSLVTFVGLAIIFGFGIVNFLETVPEIAVPSALYLLFNQLIGLLVATIGLIALGAFTRVAGVLPWWCAVALIAGSPLLLVLEWVLFRMLLGTLWPIEPKMEPNRPMSQDIIETISLAVLAVPWIVVGFAVFRAAGRRTEQPSTVR